MKKFIISSFVLFLLPLLLCGCSSVSKHDIEKTKQILDEKYTHYNDSVYIRDVISSLYATDEIIFKLFFLNDNKELGKIIDNETGEYVPYYSADIKIICSENRITGYSLNASNTENTTKTGIDFDQNGNIINVYEKEPKTDKLKIEAAFRHYITENGLNTEKAISAACNRKRVVDYNPQNYI